MKHLWQLLESSASRYPDRTFVQMKREGSYFGYRFKEFHEYAQRLSGFLLEKGLLPGEKIAILSDSSPEWGIIFFGIQGLSATAVPIDVKLKADEWNFILENSGAKGIIFSKKFKSYFNDLSSAIIQLQIEDITRLSQESTSISLKTILPSIDNSNPALIIYTSGTTGNPKGVMISHENLLSDIRMVLSGMEDFFKEKRFLSILPLNHLFELTGGLLTPLASGGTVTYVESLKAQVVLERMKETNPHIMLVVPAFLELLWREMERKINALSGLQKHIFNLMTALTKLFHGFGIHTENIFFSTIRNKFGENLQYFICGGAPLNPIVAKHFETFGFIVLEGYGLSETSPIVSVNTPGKRRIGSVGCPIKGVEVRIDSPDENGQGEIVMNGPNVMMGYFNNPSATQEVLKGGWFYSGDIGYIDSDGFLYITGRKKNLIVTAAGKKVFPEEVEECLVNSPYIKEVCVLGKKVSNDEEVYALIIPDTEYAKEMRVLDHLKDVLKDEIKCQCEKLANYKKVKDFIIWEGDFPKTTTLKLRRKKIQQIFYDKYLTVTKQTDR